MELTGKQKSTLKTLANKHRVMFQVGQHGLTDTVTQNIFDYLHKHEIGRITVLKTSPQSIDDVANALEGLGITVVCKLGKVLSLYKENKRLKDRIKL